MVVNIIKNHLTSLNHPPPQTHKIFIKQLPYPMQSGCMKYVKVGPYKIKIYKNKSKERNQSHKIHKNSQRVQAQIYEKILSGHHAAART